MKVSMKEAIQVLERTPVSLEIYLAGLPDGRQDASEDNSSWKVAEEIKQLMEAEKTKWTPAVQKILGRAAEQLPPLKGRPEKDSNTDSLKTRLLTFKAIRMENIGHLKTMERTASHIENGTIDPIEVSGLLSSWVAHDLTHLSRIVRILAKQYAKEAGPWKANLEKMEDKG